MRWLRAPPLRIAQGEKESDAPHEEAGWMDPSEWMRQLEAQRWCLAAGSRQMDRELLIDVVSSLCWGVGPEMDLDEYYEWYDGQRAKWVALAAPDWLPMGLELLANPPSEQRIRYWGSERWNREWFLYFSEVAERFAASVPELVGPWLSHPKTRDTAEHLMGIAVNPADADPQGGTATS